MSGLLYRCSVGEKPGIGSVCGGSAAEIETVSGGDDGQTDFGGNSAECGR